MEILEIIKKPWPWYVAGPMIAFIMALLLFFGRSFGVSSTLRTMCSIGGAGKFADFFRFDWKSQTWNLLFVFGALIGGFIAQNYLSSDLGINLSAGVKQELTQYGVQNIGTDFVPKDIFSFESLLTLKGFIMIVLGGFLVGFGTRWAGGCTSGHAISGLSSLQKPSLVAVIGFFIGGLITTHFLLPYILSI